MVVPFVLGIKVNVAFDPAVEEGGVLAREDNGVAKTMAVAALMA
jgi:hypothetical protein